MSIDTAKRMLQHLIDTNQAWCLDAAGVIWDRASLQEIIS